MFPKYLLLGSLLTLSALSLLATCTPKSQSSGFSQVRYQEDAPVGVTAEIPEELAAAGLRLELGMGQSLATASFASHLGVDASFQAISSPVFLRPEAGYSAGEAPTVVMLHFALDQLSASRLTAEDERLVCLYHI